MKNLMYHIPRPFIATMWRGEAAIQTRRYGYLDTATQAAMRDMMLYGHAGDVLVVHHDITGKEQGHVRMDVQGRVTADWAWESVDGSYVGVSPKGQIRAERAAVREAIAEQRAEQSVGQKRKETEQKPFGIL